ncbi:MAG: GNAT family N-acetyltransferase [Alphaproteobacteria bacterium]|nr:GNAT family N-acetyltransferase [Alphaproteobacteria bacterium]
MNVTIEIVTENTADLLDSVAEDVFDEVINPEYLKGYLKESNHTLCVALADGVVVGQVRAIIHRHPDNPPELYIDNAGVTPAFQRQGIAKMLVAEIVSVGKSLGCEDVWVGTEPDNEAAKALYRSVGLKMTDMVMFDGEI